MQNWEQYQAAKRQERDQVMANANRSPSNLRFTKEKMNYDLAGYFHVGWHPGMEDFAKLTQNHHEVENPCVDCKGRGMVPNEDVNKHRTHYKQYIFCRSCGGSGRSKHDAQG